MHNVQRSNLTSNKKVAYTVKCYICDREIDEPRRDHRDGSFRPCYVCEASIHEIVDDYARDDDDEYSRLETFLDEFEEELKEYGSLSDVAG